MSATLTEAPALVPCTSLLEQERQMLAQLRQWIEWRVQAEQAIKEQYRRRLEAIEAERRTQLPGLERNYQLQRSQWQRQLEEALAALATRQDQESTQIQNEWERRRTVFLERVEEHKAQLERQFQQRKWELQTLYEAAATDLETRARNLELNLQSESARIKAIRSESRELLRRWRQSVDQVVITRRTFKDDEDLLAVIQAKTAEAKQYLEQLRGLVLPRLFEGRRFWWIVLLSILLLAPLAVVAVAFVQEADPLAWVKLDFWWKHGLLAGVAAGAGTVVGSLLVLASFYLAARWRVNQVYQPLLAALYEATKAGQVCLERAQAEHRQRAAELKARRQQYEETLKDMVARRRRQLNELEMQSQRDLQLLDEQYQSRLSQLRQEIEQSRQQITQDIQNRLAQLDQEYQANKVAIENRYQQSLRELTEWHQHRWTEMRQRWISAMHELTESAKALRRAAYAACPPWSDSFWNDWQAPAQPPRLVPLGRFQISLEDWPGAIPEDAEMRAHTPNELVWPAALEFPERCSLLVRLPGDTLEANARAAAIRLMQMYLFRLIATLPPGKLHFTIIDPVGLGESFSALMHLADYDEALVTSRIWTEPQHIEQRLADLTAHMETVLQKYLRNQYATLEEYNFQAGELAEPYRISVVADFPNNFTSEAARRLASIVASGGRCGVYTVISADLRQPMPHGFQLEDLERAGAILVWRHGTLVWDDADFASIPLTLDPPPPDDLANRLLHRIGPAALAARRVEVPFNWVAPPPEKRWAFESSSSVEIPIGRCGATKRQYFRLGRGTAQHALIAGKTGSGKSTLFHVLITNLALHYSPEEVELYLVDFKKGVEFKTYATHRLPHARVIAIESEREFGLSVLQRLDAELRRRGEL
ncbi:ESX secretion system protein EccC [bacterium HR36]|nr:ESX secretion system protein EccC [bacterium HR36]